MSGLADIEVGWESGEFDLNAFKRIGATIGEGIAFFHWKRYNYEHFSKWHRGRTLIWFTWWNTHRGAHVA